MKQGKNYACVEDCGKMNPYSKIIANKENSLRINLLGSKNKREDVIFKYNDVKSAYTKLSNNNYPKVNKNKFKSYKYSVKNFMNDILTTTGPTCKALKSLVQDEMDED